MGYNPMFDDPDWRRRQQGADADPEIDDETIDNENRRTKMSTEKGVGSLLGGAMAKGAAAAAAMEANELLCSGAKKALEAAGAPKELLELKAVEVLLKALAPAIILIVAEKLPHLVPKHQLVSEGAALALSGATTEVLRPILGAMGPTLLQLAGSVEEQKKLAGRVSVDEEDVIEIEEVA